MISNLQPYSFQFFNSFPASISAEIIHSGWNKILIILVQKFEATISRIDIDRVPIFRMVSHDRSSDERSTSLKKKNMILNVRLFRVRGQRYFCAQTYIPQSRGATVSRGRRRFAEGGRLFSSSSLGTMREQEAFCSNAVNPYCSSLILSLSLSLLKKQYNVI